jgi:tRNA U38,U39,U40 pseudouridine synthase TruA
MRVPSRITMAICSITRVRQEYENPNSRNFRPNIHAFLRSLLPVGKRIRTMSIWSVQHNFPAPHSKHHKRYLYWLHKLLTPTSSPMAWHPLWHSTHLWPPLPTRGQSSLSSWRSTSRNHIQTNLHPEQRQYFRSLLDTCTGISEHRSPVRGLFVLEHLGASNASSERKEGTSADLGGRRWFQ